MKAAVITDEVYVEIELLRKHGFSLRKIAEEVGCAVNTVRRHLIVDSLPRYERKKRRLTKLSMFEDYLRERQAAARPAWIPAGVQVIVVTDAGFRRPWFTQVERLGWSWIGRIRAGVCVSRDCTHWEQARAWFAKATGKACRWSDCWLTREFRFACDMVL